MRLIFLTFFSAAFLFSNTTCLLPTSQIVFSKAENDLILTFQLSDTNHSVEGIMNSKDGLLLSKILDEPSTQTIDVIDNNDTQKEVKAPEINLIELKNSRGFSYHNNTPNKIHFNITKNCKKRFVLIGAFIQENAKYSESIFKQYEGTQNRDILVRNMVEVVDGKDFYQLTKNKTLELIENPNINTTVGFEDVFRFQIYQDGENCVVWPIDELTPNLVMNLELTVGTVGKTNYFENLLANPTNDNSAIWLKSKTAENGGEKKYIKIKIFEQSKWENIVCMDAALQATKSFCSVTDNNPNSEYSLLSLVSSFRIVYHSTFISIRSLLSELNDNILIAGQILDNLSSSYSQTAKFSQFCKDNLKKITQVNSKTTFLILLIENSKKFLNLLKNKEQSETSTVIKVYGKVNTILEKYQEHANKAARLFEPLHIMFLNAQTLVSKYQKPEIFSSTCQPKGTYAFSSIRLFGHNNMLYNNIKIETLDNSSQTSPDFDQYSRLFESLKIQLNKQTDLLKTQQSILTETQTQLLNNHKSIMEEQAKLLDTIEELSNIFKMPYQATTSEEVMETLLLSFVNSLFVDSESSKKYLKLNLEKPSLSQKDYELCLEFLEHIQTEPFKSMRNEPGFDTAGCGIAKLLEAKIKDLQQDVPKDNGAEFNKLQCVFRPLPNFGKYLGIKLKWRNELQIALSLVNDFIAATFRSFDHRLTDLNGKWNEIIKNIQDNDALETLRNLNGDIYAKLAEEATRVETLWLKDQNATYDLNTVFRVECLNDEMPVVKDKNFHLVSDQRVLYSIETMAAYFIMKLAAENQGARLLLI